MRNEVRFKKPDGSCEKVVNVQISAVICGFIYQVNSILWLHNTCSDEAKCWLLLNFSCRERTYHQLTKA